MRHCAATQSVSAGQPLDSGYGETVKTGDDTTERSIIEQPFFHTQSLNTSLSIDGGEMLLIGGGMPSKQEGKIVYVFISVQLVDMKGDAIKMVTNADSTGRE